MEKEKDKWGEKSCMIHTAVREERGLTEVGCMLNKTVYYAGAGGGEDGCCVRSMTHHYHHLSCAVLTL